MPDAPPAPNVPRWPRVAVLANPTAGRGRGRRLAAELAGGLEARGYRPTVDLREASQIDFAERPDALVVVGGDGTLRGAVERLVGLYGTDAPPVLPVPTGTANLMGQHLGLPRSLLDIGLDGVRGLAEGIGLAAPASLRQTVDAAAAALDRGATTAVDLAEANGRLFLLMAGVGFDAHVVHALDARRRGPIGLFDYAVPAVGAVARYDFPPVRVEVDGRRLFGPTPALVMVANVPQYGTGFPLVPDARPDDGLLDVLCLPVASRAELLKLFVLAATGGHLAARGVARARGTRIRVTADSPVPVQLDGDPGGTLPLDVRLLDARATLVRPVAATRPR